MLLCLAATRLGQGWEHVVCFSNPPLNCLQDDDHDGDGSDDNDDDDDHDDGDGEDDGHDNHNE